MGSLSSPTSVPERNVSFRALPPSMHWCTSKRTAHVRASSPLSSSVDQMLGYGSPPGSAGCSRRWPPPLAETASAKAKKLTMRALPSRTLARCECVRCGSPQTYMPRWRRGGGHPGRNRSFDHVLHGGPPRTMSMRPSSASIINAMNVAGAPKSQRLSTRRSTEQKSRAIPAI